MSQEGSEECPVFRDRKGLTQAVGASRARVGSLDFILAVIGSSRETRTRKSPGSGYEGVDWGSR